ncbi:uncharacterized protein CDAR_164461 [Caerostris darwini]|uniref:Uncharacterized protein n=1 Tax=Caerostris darwini TaxID=1538125 RepID=A0AAV4QTY0_9ARAC|nr:uncharacterized protein CDAR_164461 [Caerostris darwini]
MRSETILLRENKKKMLRKFVIALLIAVILSSCVFRSAEAGHKLKLKKIAKALLLANALTGKKILFPLPLPLPIPIFQEHVKHVPYEMMDYGGGGYGMGGGMGGGYGGGMGGYGGGMGGGYGGGMGGGGYGGGMGGGGYGGGMGGGGGYGGGMGGGYGGGMKGGGY